MIPNTIAEIEARVRQSGALPEPSKAELLNLLSTLKSEVGELAKTRGAQAASIAEHAKVVTDATIGEARNPAARQPSLDRLTGSVSEFEGTHPKLVEVVNRLATMLSNSGI
ncbi:MAG TPA: DUF4404 family protein [Candidatus Limnocylindria bacterium]|jgi:hypothetical protein|nr:DUF4404 family protein [Candidatus Limnocylindria bacterium]